MEVLSSCWRIARRQALKRPSERTLGLSSEGGNTGRRADWPCHTKITNDLLRPSVQLPAGVCGCAPYTDFGRLCKVAGPLSVQVVPGGPANPVLNTTPA